MALPASAELRRLEVRLADEEALLAQSDDLLVRLDGLKDTKVLEVDLGMGCTVEGVPNNSGRVIVAAGLDELFLDLSVERAKEFVRKRRAIVQKKKESLEGPLAQLRREYAQVAETLQKALQSQTQPESNTTSTA
ncbi:hypothetical protein JCM8547_003211 [Rhodosporidiobolus lusitaniae]